MGGREGGRDSETERETEAETTWEKPELSIPGLSLRLLIPT